jgi:hypothetical protein
MIAMPPRPIELASRGTDGADMFGAIEERW